MRLWHVLMGLAAVALVGGVLNYFRVTPNADPSVAPGALVATIVLGGAGVFLWRRGSVGQRLDHSGPVVPAEDPAVPAGTRWTLEQIAAVLAQQVEHMNGLVYADERTGTIRVMIDPATAIVRVEADNSIREMDRRRPASQRSSSGPWYRGTWWKVDLRPGKPPHMRRKQTAVGARLDDRGRAVPIWDRGLTSTERRLPTMAVLSEAQTRGSVSFTFDSQELQRTVQRIAVRAGWISDAEARAGEPPAAEQHHEYRRVERTVIDNGSSERTSTTRSFSETYRADQPHPASHEAFVSDEDLSEQSVDSLRAAHARAEDVAAGLRAENAVRGRASEAKISLIMTLVGGVILFGCLIGTVLGLAFGMPWWASFIIIGSGLFFVLVFVLPIWLLMGTPWRPRT